MGHRGLLTSWISKSDTSSSETDEPCAPARRLPSFLSLVFCVLDRRAWVCFRCDTGRTSKPHVRGSHDLSGPCRRHTPIRPWRDLIIVERRSGSGLGGAGVCPSGKRGFSSPKANIH